MKALRRRLDRIATAIGGRRITPFALFVDELEPRAVRLAIARHARTGHRGGVIVVPPMAESVEAWLEGVRAWQAEIASPEGQSEAVRRWLAIADLSRPAR